MKERITTSLSLLGDYWKEKVEPLIQKGYTLVGLFRLGVESAEQKENEKNIDAPSNQE